MGHGRTARTLIGIVVASGLMAGMVGSPSPARAAGDPVPNPVVIGPTENGIRPNPWNASVWPLETDEYAYREDEYIVEGQAFDREAGRAFPYRTRFLVRQPVDAADFNGVVVVDWMNVTNGQDWEYTWWSTSHDHLMRNGYATVAVSAQAVGVNFLRLWDPDRYGSLYHPGNHGVAPTPLAGVSREIFMQVSKAVKHGADNVGGVDPMLGREVRFLIGGGVSQSAMQLIQLIDGGYDRDGVVDAWNLPRSVGTSDLGGTPTNNTKPVFIVNEETDYNGTPQPEHRPDDDLLVVWEEAGMAHHNIEWWSYTRAGLARDLGVRAGEDPAPGCQVNRGTHGYSVRAMLEHTVRWLEDGAVPPSAPRIPRNADGSLPRDEDGHVIGGLRHPFIEVPTGSHRSTVTDCSHWGHSSPWSAETIRERYATHADYVRLVREHADAQVAAGFLLPEDRDDAVARAAGFTAPWGDDSAPPPGAAAPGDDPAGAPAPTPATGGGAALAGLVLLAGAVVARRVRA